MWVRWCEGWDDLCQTDQTSEALHKQQVHEHFINCLSCQLQTSIAKLDLDLAIEHCKQCVYMLLYVHEYQVAQHVRTYLAWCLSTHTF